MVTAGAFGAAIHGGHWEFSKRTLTQQIRRFLAHFARSTHPIRAAVAAALAIDRPLPIHYSYILLQSLWRIWERT